jgi:hypothetical protein
MSTEKKKSDPPSWLELERVLPLSAVTEITSLSHDSLIRHHKEKIVELSPRRRGMKLRNVLAIGNGK